MRAIKLILTVALATGVMRGLAAQGRPLTVRGTRPLVFGTVLPGIPRVIARTDPVNSGQFDLTGTKFASVQLTFTLPSVMTGPAGATLPLAFGGSDAGYSDTQAVGSQVGFDPKQTLVVLLNRNGRGSVFLGGTANPATSQRAGSYTATVTLSVAYVP